MAYMGIDYSVLNAKVELELDLTFIKMTDPVEICIQSIYKRITTNTLFWALDITTDIRNWQNVTINKLILERWKQKTIDLFSEELRYQVLDLEVLFNAPNTVYVNMDVLINEDKNLKLKLVIKSDSNEVSIERV